MYKKLFHPILIFVLLQVTWVSLFSLWIFWFFQNKLQMEKLAQPLGIEAFSGGYLILFGGSIMMIFILLGITYLFIYQARSERLQRLQSDFISTITHELKSPLASIQLYLETMNLRDLPASDSKKFIGLMLDDALRLSQLIDNILVVSRIRRRKLILDLVPVDVCQFIRKVIAAENKKSGWQDEISFSGQKGLMIFADPQYLEIVLLNIISNAYKYSPEKFRLQIVVNNEKGKVVLSFTDEGMGVDPKELRKVFKMFYRSPRIREFGVQGTGLGLFIVRDIVRAMNGKATVQSPGLGQGITIKLSLPSAVETV